MGHPLTSQELHAMQDHSLTIPVADNATDAHSTIVRSVLLAGILHFSPLERLGLQEATAQQSWHWEEDYSCWKSKEESRVHVF